MDLESHGKWGRNMYNLKECNSHQKRGSRDFPGGLVVKTLPSNEAGVGSIPSQGAKTPYASWPKKRKHENISNVVINSIKTLKMVHNKKKIFFKKKREDQIS